MNPAGTITLPTALARYRKVKWADANPYDELSYLWSAAQRSRDQWNVSPGSPLWTNSPAPKGADAETQKAELFEKIEHILESEPKAEAEEFFDAFRAGALTAIDSAGRHAEPEAWAFYSAQRTGGGDLAVKNVAAIGDWHDLFVSEETFAKWAARHKPGGPHPELSRNRKVVRATLQVMMLFEVVTLERAEELSREWGYRRFIDTAATLAADAALAPAMGPKTLSARQQAEQCADWLQKLMAASPTEKKGNKDDLWPTAHGMFPLVAKRTFTHIIWPNAARPYAAWNKGGRTAR